MNGESGAGGASVGIEPPEDLTPLLLDDIQGYDLAIVLGAERAASAIGAALGEDDPWADDGAPLDVGDFRPLFPAAVWGEILTNAGRYFRLESAYSQPPAALTVDGNLWVVALVTEGADAGRALRVRVEWARDDRNQAEAQIRRLQDELEATRSRLPRIDDEDPDRDVWIAFENRIQAELRRIKVALQRAQVLLAQHFSQDGEWVVQFESLRGRLSVDGEEE